MGWEEKDAMSERCRFIVEWEQQEWTMAELCRRFGITRKIGYKWRERFEQEGWAGLEERSRAPRRHPNQTGSEVEELVLQMRRQHSTWGPLKLKRRLERELERPMPAASTIGLLLQRHGLTVQRKPRARSQPAAAPLTQPEAANQVWCADFKGYFHTGDGRRCDPLTITDRWSRYLLRCQITRPDYLHTRALFEATFRENGLPAVIRTDNGEPFASPGIGGLSRLSVWWVRLGVRPERIPPGRPQQNGQHERGHRTLSEDAIHPAAANPRAQQRRFDRFRHGFNHERPHQGIALQVPADLYQPSPRLYTARLAAVDYPAHMQVRRVNSGQFKWGAEKVFLGHALEGEDIALECVHDRYSRIWLCSYALGVFDTHERRVLSPRRRADRAVLDSLR